MTNQRPNPSSGPSQHPKAEDSNILNVGSSLRKVEAPYTSFANGGMGGPFKCDLSISPLLSDPLHSIFDSQDLSLDDALISVSTAFHPSAYPFLPPTDTLLVSEDQVFFYVHSTVILLASTSAFESVIGGLLDDPSFRNATIYVPALSAELNVILHVLYDLTPTNYAPTLENFINAVDMMPGFSFSPQTLILPQSQLHAMFLLIAPLHPMDIYILAAHHCLHELAVGTSAHLLSYPMESITDDQAERMGAVYLRRLVNLRLRRFAALKSILLHAPFPHAPSKKCGFGQQSKLTRAWALAVSRVVWDSRLDLSVYGLQSTLDPLTEDMECSVCQDLLQTRIKDAILQWTAVEASSTSIPTCSFTDDL